MKHSCAFCWMFHVKHPSPPCEHGCAAHWQRTARSAPPARRPPQRCTATAAPGPPSVPAFRHRSPQPPRTWPRRNRPVPALASVASSAPASRRPPQRPMTARQNARSQSGGFLLQWRPKRPPSNRSESDATHGEQCATRNAQPHARDRAGRGLWRIPRNAPYAADAGAEGARRAAAQSRSVAETLRQKDRAEASASRTPARSCPRALALSPPPFGPARRGPRNA